MPNVPIKTLPSDLFQVIQTRANQGHTAAQHNLALIHHYGLSGKKSYIDSVKWLKKAANKGYPISQYMLAQMYLYGFGVVKNDKKAAEYLKKSANQGLAVAQNDLSLIYENDDSDKEIIFWLEKASKQGLAVAQYNLGLIYQTGDPNSIQNYETAVNYYQLAANQGLAIAQYELGRMYQYGWGVQKDHVIAARWYLKAAILGENEAKEDLKQYFSLSCFCFSNILKNVVFAFQKYFFNTEDVLSSLRKGLHDLKSRYIFLEGYFRRDLMSDQFVASSLLVRKASAIQQLADKYLEVLGQFNQPGFLVNCISVNPDVYDYDDYLIQKKRSLYGLNLKSSEELASHLLFVPSNIDNLLESAELANKVNEFKRIYYGLLHDFISKHKDQKSQYLQSRLYNPKDNLGQYFTDWDIEFSNRLNDQLTNLILYTTDYRNQLFLDKVWN